MNAGQKELAIVRETARATMRSVLRLVTVARTSDGLGGSIEGDSTLGEPTVCRIAPVSAREREFGGRVSAKTEYRVFCPHDFSVTYANRVEVDGNAYEIEEVLSPPSAEAVQVVLGVSRL